MRPFAAAVVISFCLAQLTFAAESKPPQAAPIEYVKETLDNGLRVIYAPMRNAPVVHVRVMYHVGSKDEKPDRQGFAHMFEHMMFRGSEHVAPEQHMKMIGEAGGNSNAFTSDDQTTYVNTIPSSHTEMTLYLEADRMASFKVSDEIFKTERKVVSEEWRLRTANPPYGMVDQDFSKLAFRDHSYRWTTIGDMEQLRRASSSELQEFYNKYYVPNNACLIIAGNIDVEKTKEQVHKYFGWIPKGPAIERGIKPEPDQTEQRRLTVHKNVPLTMLTIGYKTPEYASDDHFSLDMLSAILAGRGFGGGGRGGMGGGAAVNTSRLNRLLVNNDTPMCVSVSANDEQREDPSIFSIQARLLPGADAAAVESTITRAINDVIDKGVTQEELDRARTGSRVALIRARETCTRIATELGEEEVFGGDVKRVNQKLENLEAVTPKSIQEAAKKYLTPQRSTVLVYAPPVDTDGAEPRTAAATQEAKAEATANAPVVESPKPIKRRIENFPEHYPPEPPKGQPGKTTTYAKGEESTVNGVKLIVMADHRLPLVSWSLIMRSGSDAEPKGKEGLGSLTAQMLRRGSGEMTYQQIAQDLESRGIVIDAMDLADNTRLNVSCTSDQLDHASDVAKMMLRQPAFPQKEFDKVRLQASTALRASMAQSATAASRELNRALFGDSPLGRQSSPQSIGSISLDDVKKWYAETYRPNDAILVISGDVTPEKARQLAEKLLADWKPADSLAAANYDLPPAPTSRKIILIDNPDGKQSTIRMSNRAYDVRADDDKFAGTLASQILSSGIDSRLGRYVRAEKGFTYGVRGTFQPGRHGGSFDLTVDTNPETTGPCIEACFKVLKDITGESPVKDDELAQAKQRAIGSMVMDMQTIQSQTTRRVDQILNGYPIDYYDQLPEKLAAVKPDQVQSVVAKYVKPDEMVIVVVGPASEIKTQLDALGTVEVKPMPAAPAGGGRRNRD